MAKKNRLTQLQQILRALISAHQAAVRMDDIALAKKFNDMKNTVNSMYNQEFSRLYKVYKDKL